MHRTVKSHPHHLRHTAGVIAVSLVDLCLQHRSHVPRLNADHRQVCFTKCPEQPLRQRFSLQSYPLKMVGRSPQHPKQSIGLARNLNLSNDFTRAIHNADARVLDRYVQSSKIVHAALLLLMLGARTTVTPFHHQPEAQHPKFFQLSTSRRPITPSVGTKRTSQSGSAMSAFGGKADITAFDPKRTRDLETCCSAKKLLSPISPVANPCCNLTLLA